MEPHPVLRSRRSRGCRSARWRSREPVADAEESLLRQISKTLEKLDTTAARSPQRSPQRLVKERDLARSGVPFHRPLMAPVEWHIQVSLYATHTLAERFGLPG